MILQILMFTGVKDYDTSMLYLVLLWGGNVIAVGVA